MVKRGEESSCSLYLLRQNQQKQSILHTMRTFPIIMGKSLEFDVLAFSWMSHCLEFVEVVVDVFISTDVKNKQWIIWSDLLYIPSWRISPKSSWFCKLAMKCLRQHGGRLSRCLAFAVPQWPMKLGAWSWRSQSHFLLFLFSHFSNWLSPSFAFFWANSELSGFSLHLHFTLNDLSFHTTLKKSACKPVSLY